MHTSRRDAWKTVGFGAVAAAAAGASALAQPQPYPATPLGIYNVKAYGATGNGSTDDTTAIAAAINAVPANGGTVYFPQGTYVITMGSLPAVPAFTWIVGSGFGSIIAPTNGSGAYAIDFSSGSSGSPSSGQGLFNIQFSGGGNGGPLIRGYYVVNFHMSGVRCFNFHGGACSFAQIWDSRIHHCFFLNSYSTSAPCLLFQSSAATSGFGFSSDNSNEVFIHDIQCEVFSNQGLVIQNGPGGANINNFYVQRVKLENENLTNVPLMTVSGLILGSFSDIYLAADSFLSGYSSPINMMECSGGPNYYQNIMMFANSGTTAIGMHNTSSEPDVINTLNWGSGGPSTAVLSIAGVQPIILNGVVSWNTGITPYSGAPSSAPGSGSYYIGTFIRNIGGANMSSISGWLCTASGSPGTWRALS